MPLLHDAHKADIEARRCGAFSGACLDDGIELIGDQGDSSFCSLISLLNLASALTGCGKLSLGHSMFSLMVKRVAVVCSFFFFNF